jgi:hypothetical protein
MKPVVPVTSSNAASGVRASTRSVAGPAADARDEPGRDRLLVFGATMLVIGLGSFILALTEVVPTATVPRQDVVTMPTCAVCAAPPSAWPSESDDPKGAPPADARRVGTGDGPGGARFYLLEMAARLRRATLGADPATRATVGADVTTTYAWGGVTPAAREGPTTARPATPVRVAP